jgi:hypothetical protein
MTNEKLEQCFKELSELADRKRKSAAEELGKNNIGIGQNEMGFATGVEFTINLIRAIDKIGE